MPIKQSEWDNEIINKCQFSSSTGSHTYPSHNKTIAVFDRSGGWFVSWVVLFTKDLCSFVYKVFLNLLVFMYTLGFLACIQLGKWTVFLIDFCLCWVSLLSSSLAWSTLHSSISHTTWLNLNGTSQLSVNSEPLVSYFSALTKIEMTRSCPRNIS